MQNSLLTTWRFSDQTCPLVAKTESMWKQKPHFGNNSFNKACYTVAAVTVKYWSLKGNTNSSSIALNTSKGSKDLECWKELQIFKVSHANKTKRVCNGDLNNVKVFISEEGRWMWGRNGRRSGGKRERNGEVKYKFQVLQSEDVSCPSYLDLTNNNNQT